MVKNLALAAIVAMFATTAFAETKKEEATTVTKEETTTTTTAPADAAKADTAKEEAKK